MTDWRPLIPHRGAMCLLDTVLSWDDTRIHARATSHRDPHNPLRRDDRLHAVALCEYAAQAMAIHGGLLARRAARAAAPGWIASLREIRLHVTRIDDLPGDLDVYAQAQLVDAVGWQHAFRITHAGTPLASGRIAIAMAMR
jgi:predicted hotdog family 3-hydroxylacyl-ACP dehydratase